ncbi:RNA 2',3'-cyclic phosphodiesterase [Marinobacter sp.]|uniref:RNA 2',3'-cyclic phosphodiesterase n=1 Tax=Marinobacter sp. TaxID=50741 RepID=UPI0035698DF7
MPRLFVGLELPQQTSEVLLGWRADVEGARWQRQDQMHLTLCFLGQVQPEQVPALFRAMEGPEPEDFCITPTGVGCFGDPDRPRNLWVGVEPEAPVIGLHEWVSLRLVEQGFGVEGRHFRPHITLARFGRHQAGSARDFLAQYRGRSAPELLVQHVSLFLSNTSPEGSRYQVLARFPLKQGLDAPHALTGPQ